jgi:hypothetical protein
MTFLRWLRGVVSIPPTQILNINWRPPRAIREPALPQRRARQRLMINLVDCPRNRKSIQMGTYLLGQPASDDWRTTIRELEARYRRRP